MQCSINCSTVPGHPCDDTLKGNRVSTETIRLHQDDNVVVALRAHGTIPAGHKIASEAISPGTPIIKYGQVIGIASKTVSAGEHVHTHNVDASGTAGEDTALHEAVSTEPVASPRTCHGTRVCFYELPRLRPDVDHRPGCRRC